MLIVEMIVTFSLLILTAACLGRPGFKDPIWWWIASTLLVSTLLLANQVFNELHL